LLGRAIVVSKGRWRIPLIAAEKKNKVNDEITAPEVRVIDAEGAQLGVISLEAAVQAAAEASLDLVEIQPNAEPPVCRLMDNGKFQFEQNKRKQAAKKKQVIVHLKEVKFRPGTDEGDYQVKLRNLRRFLGQGDKAKVTLWFRGREMAHQELGLKLLRRVEADLDELAKVEQFPKLEGRRLSMVMSPRK